jgi:glycosyltransferase involved in cell wall biosynthesis
VTQASEQHRRSAAKPAAYGARRPTEVIFLAPGDIGKGRVEPISWMQTCRAYAEQGLAVTLVTLRVRRVDAVPLAQVWGHYGLDPTFTIVAAPTMLRQDPPVLWFRLWAGLVSAWFAIRTLIRELVEARAVLVHVRQPVHAVPFVLIRRLLPRRRRPWLVFETHAMPKPAHGWVITKADLVVTNSEKLARDIRTRFGVAAGQVLHAPLGPHNQIRPQPKDGSRATLDLDQSARIAAYVGKLTEDISEFLLQSARLVLRRERHFQLLIVGGNPTILSWTRRRIEELGLDGSVILPGFVEPARIELYQAAADVLLFHVPRSIGTFDYCTPSKGYEYQAAQRPIVATDIPLFEEQFGDDGERAIRVREHTPEAFAEGVLNALSLEDGGEAMADRAAAWVEQRTWHARVDAILAALREDELQQP